MRRKPNNRAMLRKEHLGRDKQTIVANLKIKQKEYTVANLLLLLNEEQELKEKERDLRNRRIKLLKEFGDLEGYLNTPTVAQFKLWVEHNGYT